MKKVVLNISDSQYEKFRFEAIKERKSIPELLHDRLFYKPFDIDVEKAFDGWMENEIENILKD